MENMDPFIPVSLDDNQILVEILASRLPISASIYNMAKMRERFVKKDMQFYTIFGHLTGDKAWIITTFERDDYGKEICVSAPPNEEWSDDIKSSFLETKIFKWDQPYWFTSLDKRISHGLIEINITNIGNAVRIHPNRTYYMTCEDAENIKIEEPHEKDVIVKKMNEQYGMEFIANNWAYKLDGTMKLVEKLCSKNESFGVFVQGVPVSGIIQAHNGLMGMLTTLKGHQNKGYGTLCTKYLMKFLGQNGLLPCSTVELKNDTSRYLHEKKLGMVVSHEVDDIFFLGNGFNKT